jgi:O-antigen ligase
MNENKLKTRENIELYLGFLSICLIPINKHWVIISMLGWFVITLINFTLDRIQKRRININKKSLIPILILPCFYILHIIGLAYSSNLEYGFFDLEVKLSMILIPIIILIRSSIYQNKQKLIFTSLISGVLISFFINITHAYFNYLTDGQILNFYYCLLSPSIHPSYMAMYIGVSLIALIYYKTKLFNSGKVIRIAFPIISAVILLAYLFMLSSKAGIISFAIAISIYASIRISQRIKPIYAIIAGIVILIIPFIVINQIPSVSMRFKEMSSSIKNIKNATIDSEYGSLARLAIIQSMYHMSVENLPWGVGTGDIKDEITKYYLAKGSKLITTQYINAHNQFAQSTIALGIPGLSILLTFLTLGLIVACKNRNIIFLSFLLLLIIQMLFESMLEQQAGVIFITLLYSLFCIWDNKQLNNSENTV